MLDLPAAGVTYSREPLATSARKKRNLGPLQGQHTTQPCLQPEEFGGSRFCFHPRYTVVCCFVFV